MPSKREMKTILGEVQAKRSAQQSQVFWQLGLARLKISHQTLKMLLQSRVCPRSLSTVCPGLRLLLRSEFHPSFVLPHQEWSPYPWCARVVADHHSNGTWNLPSSPQTFLTNLWSDGDFSSRFPYQTLQLPQAVSSLHNVHLPLGLQIMKYLLNMYICSKFIQLHEHLSNVFYDSFTSHTLDDREYIYLMHFALFLARHQVLIIFNKCV